MLHRVGSIGLFASVLTSIAGAQIGTVEHYQKISEIAGGSDLPLQEMDYFGWSIAPLGDLDGDGILDVAVGAIGTDDGGPVTGAVWILFLNADGTYRARQKISATAGGFGPGLDSADFFGNSVSRLGDLNGDGVVDLAVGAYDDDDGGTNAGAVWIVFLNSNGTVASKQKISATSGGFGGAVEAFYHFGAGLAALGDVNGDGVTDLAVGTEWDNEGAPSAGAVWILFLDTDGTVVSEQKISALQGGFGGVLHPADEFGSSVAAVGDLDGNGITELAVGADWDDDGDLNAGALWILFLDEDGTVVGEQKISAASGGFSEDIAPDTHLGRSCAALGDVNGDGVPDIAVGAAQQDDGGLSRGAVWVLFLNPDGTVGSQQKISSTAGGFGGSLDDVDYFGASIASLGDLDGDGSRDMAVGAIYDDDGAHDQGAVWMLFLEGDDTTPPVLSCPPVARRSAAPGKIVFFTVAASDDLDPAPTVTCVPPSGSFFPVGTTMVTATATDLSGNESQCVFPVIVVPRGPVPAQNPLGR